MLKALIIQVAAGIAAGWAAEYLERTRSESQKLVVRWVALTFIVAGAIIYAYALGWAMRDPTLRTIEHFAAGGALVVCFAATYYARKRKMRG